MLWAFSAYDTPINMVSISLYTHLEIQAWFPGKPTSMLLCFAVGLSCFVNPINSLSWRCICGTQDAERKFVSQSSRPFHLLNHLIKNESKSETNQGSYDLELRQSIFSDSFCSVKLGWASPVRKTANIRPDDIDIVSNSLLWMLLLDRHSY